MKRRKQEINEYLIQIVEISDIHVLKKTVNDYNQHIPFILILLQFKSTPM